MKKYKIASAFGNILMWAAVFGLIIWLAYVNDIQDIQIQELKGHCNCTINYGGHNMSVEDAFERAGEGLTVDQADEVEILIEEYCNASK